MPTSTKTEEPKRTLPVGHPQAGYVEPDLSYHEGTGTLPDEEIEFHEARNEAREAEVQAVAENEDAVAKAEVEKREERAAQARERLQKIADGEATFQQIAEAQTAQAALDATEDTSDTSTKTTRSSSASSSGSTPSS
jgi:hypothetical protein